MRRIIENDNVLNEKECCSADVLNVGIDCLTSGNKSDCRSQQLGHKKHNHSHNDIDAIVKDFALSHHTADFCEKEKFSLKAMEKIMKECLVAIGAQTVINNSSYKQLKKEIFDCIPYSDWYSPKTFPTTLKLYHQNIGFLF